MQLFEWKEGREPVKKIDINSNWKEPGQNSYLREYEAYNVLKCVLNTSEVYLSLDGCAVE